MNSNPKNFDLVQVLTSLKKSKEYLFLRNKKVKYFKKRRKNLLFYHFFVYPRPVRTKSNSKYYPQF